MHTQKIDKHVQIELSSSHVIHMKCQSKMFDIEIKNNGGNKIIT